MLIKIDHTVYSLLAEDRGSVIEQLEKSTKMYSWVNGENIGDTVDDFALANPKATFGDLVAWTKKTYMDRLRARKEESKFADFKMTGDYNPTGPEKGSESQAKFGKHGESAKGVSVISDAAPSRPKLKKVAEPGQEAEVDAADQAALYEENPTIPPTDYQSLKPIEAGQQPDPVLPSPNDAFAAFKAKSPQK